MSSESHEASASRPPRRFSKGWLLTGTIVLVLVVTAITYLLRRPNASGSSAGQSVPTVAKATRQGAGQPVPTVAEVSGSAATAATTEKADLMIAPEMLARIRLKVTEVRTQEVASQLRTTGTVQPNSYRETRVFPIAGGIIKNIRAELGEQVTKGQSLAVIFSQELADAQMKYLAVHANYGFHEAQHKRYEKLAEIGAISQQEMEEVMSRLEEHHAEYASLRQRLKLLGLTETQIDNLRDSSQVTSDVYVPAPSSGVITVRNANLNQVVTTSDALFSVTDLSQVWVIANVYEKDFAALRNGGRVTITTPSYQGRTFTGAISYIDPRVDPTTRTGQARIEVANPRQMLKLGMFVDVALAAPGKQTAVVIPKSALQTIGNEQVAFVQLAQPGQFQMRRIQTGEEVGQFVRVLSGVSAGEKVVTEGSFFLRAEMGRSGNL